MYPFRKTALSATLLLGSGLAANATPIAVVGNGVANTIVGVAVGGTTYNVTFAGDVIDQTFDQDTAGEVSAASQIETALNATNAAFVESSGFGSINQFIVGNILTGGQQVASGSFPGKWQDTGFANNDASGSVFTAVPNPTVVLGAPQVVTAVDGLVVDDVTYNVSFAADAIDQTFDNDPTAEGVAAAELENALNGSGAAFVAEPGAGAIDQFVVGDTLTGGIEVASNFLPGTWQNVGIVTDDASSAVFARVSPVTGPAPVPEPGSLPMLATGLIGFAVARGRRAGFRALTGRSRGCHPTVVI